MAVREVELGWTYGPPQCDTKWNGLLPEITCYKTRYIAKAVFNIPNDTNEILEKARRCALEAAGVTGIAVIIGAGPGVLPTFQAAFARCFGSMEGIGIGLKVDTQRE